MIVSLLILLRNYFLGVIDSYFLQYSAFHLQIPWTLSTIIRERKKISSGSEILIWKMKAQKTFTLTLAYYGFFLKKQTMLSKGAVLQEVM